MLASLLNGLALLFDPVSLLAGVFGIMGGLFGELLLIALLFAVGRLGSGLSFPIPFGCSFLYQWGSLERPPWL